MSFNCLLVTHNNIIQCFIERLRPSAQKVRFKNCAILCLSLDLKTNQFKIIMVYNGLLSEEETNKISIDKPYYIKEKTEPSSFVYNEGEIYFKPITGDISSLNILPEDLTRLENKTGKNVINFYIVRHGQAEHNEKKFNPFKCDLWNFSKILHDLNVFESTNNEKGLWNKFQKIDNLQLPTAFRYFYKAALLHFLAFYSLICLLLLSLLGLLAKIKV